MLKKGDRVQFIDGRLNRIFPHHYPAAFSKGTIIDIDRETQTSLKYQVRWDNKQILSWWYTDKEIRKAF